MQTNVDLLAKKAIDLALKGNWSKAATVNQQILNKDPKNLNAKIRLGRAYIQIKEFTKAKKLFKEVLGIDPINSVALKNYKIASEKKFDSPATSIDPKVLLMEPGTTTEVQTKITSKNIDAEDFISGEVLNIEIRKNDVNLFKIGVNKEARIITLDGELAKKFRYVKSQKGTLTASFVRGKNKDIVIMVKSTIAVFKSEKQIVKPYIKKGTIDEPELEITDMDESYI